MLPPISSFFSFNIIVFTTNLLVHDYWFKLSVCAHHHGADRAGRAGGQQHQADRSLSRRR
jgi:hypothetical protein